MADIKELGEALVNLTVKEVNELATYLKEEHGIEPAAAAVAVAGPAGGGDEAAAKNAMFAGMAKSMNKVTNFYPRTNRFDGVMAFYFGGLDQVINDFYARISDEWDDASDKMNVLGMQYFVAQFGNGLDAYNFYRRTGYPTTLQPNIEADPGGFIRSFFYPANHANTNQNISQKDGVTDPVFWDTNPGSPGFPVAN